MRSSTGTFFSPISISALRGSIAGAGAAAAAGGASTPAAAGGGRSSDRLRDGGGAVGRAIRHGTVARDRKIPGRKLRRFDPAEDFRHAVPPDGGGSREQRRGEERKNRAGEWRDLHVKK